MNKNTSNNQGPAARPEPPVGRIVHCPIIEQTGDGATCGRCWFTLIDGRICERHGDVENEVVRFLETNRCTLENDMRRRKGLKLLG